MHERIDPKKDTHVMELSRLAHYKRYQKATEYIQAGSTILDIGCGTGYGSSILASKGNLVLAIDNNAQAIQYAKKHYPQESIQYKNQDIENIKTDTKFNVITCFEVLEHTEDPDQVIKICREHIDTAGTLIISVPNGKNAAQNNEHHQQNFTKQEIKTLLEEAGFSIEEIYEQYAPLGSIGEIIRRITGKSTNTNTRQSKLAKYINYLPYFANIFSNLYKEKYTQGTGRTIYMIAKPK